METRRADRIIQHQALCPYGTYTCPLQCRVRLTKEALLQHVNWKHGKEVYRCSERVDYVKVQNYDITKTYTQAIVAYDEIFVRTIRVANNIWHFLLQYIGPDKDHGRFTYTVAFHSEDRDDVFIKVTHGCRSINEDVNEIYRTCKCIMLPTEVVKCTMEGGELGYYFHIKKY
jgi:hypothetical protein